MQRVRIEIDFILVAGQWNGKEKTDPELDKEERRLWPFVIQLFQAPFLLREFVVDLPDVHRLQYKASKQSVEVIHVSGPEYSKQKY